MSSCRNVLVRLLGGSMVLLALLPSFAWSQDPTFHYQQIVTSATPGASQFAHPTTLALAPDGRLFFAQQNGKIHYVTLNRQFQVVGSVGRIDTIFNRGLSTTPQGRAVLGMTFGPDGDLFVAHSDVRVFDAAIDTSSGAVTRLLASTGYTTFLDIVTGLPRSRINHGPNGLAFKPGPGGNLFLAQGGMTNAGLPLSGTLWSAPETPASGTIIEIDVDTGASFVHATGLRNPYDLLFHSNGKLYANDNGANPGSGVKPVGGGSCAPSTVTPETPDELNWIQENHYYGHPNPPTGRCDFNPAGSHTEPIHEYGMHVSANGMAEYASAVLPGRGMQGNIITARFANTEDVVTVKLSTNGEDVVSSRVLRAGLANPLDVLVRSDGSIFIAEYSLTTGISSISVLKTRVPPRTDFNGDRRGDLVLFRPSTSEFLVRDTATGVVSNHSFGGTGDVPVALDYDGDGQIEFAIFRPSIGEWHWWSVGNFSFGMVGDIPVPGDFNGDGRTDLAFFRPSASEIWIRDTATGTVTTGSFGGPANIPFALDHNGDGIAEIGMWNTTTGEWHWSSVGSFFFGLPGDIPFSGDFDGDGRTDVAVFRAASSQVFIRDTATSTISGHTFGGPGDIPVAIDFDGDGRTEFAMFNPSRGDWHWWSIGMFTFGTSGDIPIRPAF